MVQTDTATHVITLSSKQFETNLQNIVFTLLPVLLHCQSLEYFSTALHEGISQLLLLLTDVTLSGLSLTMSIPLITGKEL